MNQFRFSVPSISPPEHSTQSITKTQVTLMTITLDPKMIGKGCGELKRASENHSGNGRGKGGISPSS